MTKQHSRQAVDTGGSGGMARGTPRWLTAMAVVLPILMVVVGGVQSRVDSHLLYRDPVKAMEIALETDPGIGDSPNVILLGSVSNFGVVLWCMACAVCLFAAAVVCCRVSRSVFLCLVSTGLISGVLLMDDLYMAHEMVYTSLLGLHDKITFSIYACFLLLHAVYFRRVIRTYAPQLLVMSVVVFALAAGFDVFSKDIKGLVPSNPELIQQLGEDGFKLMGLFMWLGYCARFSWLVCREAQSGCDA